MIWGWCHNVSPAYISPYLPHSHTHTHTAHTLFHSHVYPAFRFVFSLIIFNNDVIDDFVLRNRKKNHFKTTLIKISLQLITIVKKCLVKNVKLKTISRCWRGFSDRLRGSGGRPQDQPIPDNPNSQRATGKNCCWFNGNSIFFVKLQNLKENLEKTKPLDKYVCSAVFTP